MSRILRDGADEALLERYKAGDVAALEALLDRYEGPLYNFIARQIRNEDRARDLVQDALLRLVQHAEEFRGQAKLRTWLYRIARNLCIDHLRRQVHRRHASLDAPRGDEADAPSLHDRLPSSDRGGEGGASDRQLARRIELAVAELPDDQREVFVLRQVQQMSFRDIADVVGIPENTAKSRMRYALERLQAALVDCREPEGGAQ